MRFRFKNTSLYWWSKSIKYYLANHFIANCPIEKVRHYFYKKFLKIEIGKHTHLSMNIFITGFHKKPEIKIGDHCVINRQTYLDGRMGIEIEDNVNISFGCTILTLQHEVQSPNFECKGSKVVIKKNAWIGLKAIIMPGVEIGEGAVVGAGAVVTKNVSPYTIVAGVPAKPIGIRNSNLSYLTNFHPYADTDVFNESK